MRKISIIFLLISGKTFSQEFDNGEQARIYYHDHRIRTVTIHKHDIYPERNDLDSSLDQWDESNSWVESYDSTGLVTKNIYTAGFDQYITYYHYSADGTLLSDSSIDPVKQKYGCWDYMAFAHDSLNRVIFSVSIKHDSAWNAELRSSYPDIHLDSDTEATVTVFRKRSSKCTTYIGDKVDSRETVYELSKVYGKHEMNVDLFWGNKYISFTRQSRDKEGRIVQRTESNILGKKQYSDLYMYDANGMLVKHQTRYYYKSANGRIEEELFSYEFYP